MLTLLEVARFQPDSTAEYNYNSTPNNDTFQNQDRVVDPPNYHDVFPKQGVVRHTTIVGYF